VSDYREINRANWDDRVPAHLASDYYSVQRFLAEPDFISDVVRFDLPRLGDVRGLRGAHLQCHIGTDTISLARLGASMTGLDFSGKAVQAAQELASGAGADVTFVQSDVYLAAGALGAGKFDLVYTGVGSLPWLPDIAVTPGRTRQSRTRSRNGGITGSARSSRHCSTPACGSRSSPSTTASRGLRSPAQWSTSETGNTGWPTTRSAFPTPTPSRQ
jgi:Methyltransferase domain